MIERLKTHPFAVNAFFRHSLVLTYALPASQIIPLIPDPLDADLFHNEWGFVAAAFVQTVSLRPAVFPEWAGNDFVLAGYRLFVRYTNLAGHKLRGLYILGSETDSRKMTILGNTFTHYRYLRSDLRFAKSGSLMTVDAPARGLHVSVDVPAEEPALPSSSPFTNWKEARRFAGPMPYTFSIDNKGNVVVVEGVRSNWTPRPVKVLTDEVPFLSRPEFAGALLANAFVVENIPYSWKKGITEKWR